MQYLTVEGTKITGHYCAPALPDGAIKIRDSFNGFVGQDIREFDENWELLPLAERVDSGALELPKGLKVVGEELSPMSEAELVQAGINERPAGFILGTDADGNQVLRAGNNDELLAMGDISKNEWHERNIKIEEAELLAYLAASRYHLDIAKELGEPVWPDVLEKRAAARKRITEIRNDWGQVDAEVP